MIYTKVMREYCLQNKGIVLDIAKEYKEHFSMIPYRTYCKILNRLEEEKVISRISHGAYLVGRKPSKSKDQVVDYYTSNENGLVIGYSFYNQIGVSSYKNDHVEILTRLIDSKTKKVGNHLLTKANIVFNDKTIPLIYLLELLENGSSIKECDDVKKACMIEYYLNSYSDFFFEEVIKAIDFNYSTICTLNRIMSNIDKKDNNCLKIYIECELKKNYKGLINE